MTKTRFSEIMKEPIPGTTIFRACNESATPFLRELSVGRQPGIVKPDAAFRVDTRAGFHVPAPPTASRSDGQKSVSCPLPGSVFARNSASSSYPNFRALRIATERS